METVTIHAKTFEADGYDEQTVSGYQSGPSLTLSTLVAPNNDPTRIAVGRADVPVHFDVYIPGVEPLGIDPEQQVAKIRGAVYEIDGRSEEWTYKSGTAAGDHFTVTAPFVHPAAESSSSSSSSSS